MDLGCLKRPIFLHVWNKLTALQVHDGVLAALSIHALGPSWLATGVANAEPGAETIIVGSDKFSMRPTDSTLSINAKRALCRWSGIEWHPTEAWVLRSLLLARLNRP